MIYILPASRSSGQTHTLEASKAGEQLDCFTLQRSDLSAGGEREREKTSAVTSGPLKLLYKSGYTTVFYQSWLLVTKRPVIF